MNPLVFCSAGMGPPRGVVTAAKTAGHLDTILVRGIPNHVDVHYPYLQTCTLRVPDFPAF